MPEKCILEAFGTKVPDGDVTVKIDHVLSAHFRPFSESDRKNEAFQKKHLINLKTEKQPKMKFFDFGTFLNISFTSFLGHFKIFENFFLRSLTSAAYDSATLCLQKIGCCTLMMKASSLLFKCV